MASNSKPKSSKVILAEKPAITPTIPTESGPAASFRAEVEAAKAKLRDADQAPEPVKNKGGRPSKAEVEAKLVAERAQAAAQLEQVVPAEALKPIVALPFTVIAAQTGCQDLLLRDEEADAIVPSLHEVLKIYAPQVKGEHMALTSLGLAVTSIGLSKYLVYQNWKRSQAIPRAETPTNPDQRPVEPAQVKEVPGQIFPTSIMEMLNP